MHLGENAVTDIYSINYLSYKLPKSIKIYQIVPKQ